MFLSDDDYLPNEYLNSCLDNLKNKKNLNSIIPAYTAVYKDGISKIKRQTNFEEKYYPTGKKLF